MQRGDPTPDRGKEGTRLVNEQADIIAVSHLIYFERHWRDTVLVHGKEEVDVGLVAEERGQWMMHCHVLEHADSGMMTLLSVE